MKKQKSVIVILLVLFASLHSFAQITITNSDMPAVDDTFRVSNGLITPAIDPIPTGGSYTWDFSMLEWISQDVDSFVSVASTGPIYSLVFANLPFNTNRANLASKGADLPAIPQVSISDVNNFIYNSTASYLLTGYGALVNGLSVPIPFGNKDVIYKFPMDFGNLDSSDSDFQISLPGLGFYGHNQHRVNEVDGWGTLITPFGTFNTLRVRSDITANDSVYLDSLGIGFGFPVPQTIEYKWLGALGGIPYLQINTTVTLGVETVSSIRYRDSLRTLTGIVENPDNQHFSSTVFPNPVKESLVVDLNLLKGGDVNILIYNSQGEKIAVIWSGAMAPGQHRVNYDAKEAQLATGLYFVEIMVGSEREHTPFIFTGK